MEGQWDLELGTFLGSNATLTNEILSDFGELPGTSLSLSLLICK